MRIITLTPNPAFDVHCHVADFRAEHENLAAVISRDAGGKGVNISRALTQNGVENLALVVLGRENASDFRNALAKDGISLCEILVDGRIRENITVHTDTAQETRISFAGFSADGTLLARMDAAMERDLADCIVTFTGRVPNGISMKDVKEFLSNLRARGAKLVIDSKSFSLDDLIECRPWLIKPNEEEIGEYLGHAAESFEKIADAAKALQNKGIENVMISLGSKGAMLVCNEGCFVATPPRIEARSTIGAGDSSIAGFLAAFTAGAAAQACLCEAVAYGSAACLREGTQPPRREDVRKIRRHVRMEAFSCDE